MSGARCPGNEGPLEHIFTSPEQAGAFAEAVRPLTGRSLSLWHAGQVLGESADGVRALARAGRLEAWILLGTGGVSWDARVSMESVSREAEARGLIEGPHGLPALMLRLGVVPTTGYE